MRRGPYNRNFVSCPDSSCGLYVWRVFLGLTQQRLADLVSAKTGRRFSRQDVARVESGFVRGMDGEEWLAVIDALNREIGSLSFVYRMKPASPCLEDVIRNTARSWRGRTSMR